MHCQIVGKRYDALYVGQSMKTSFSTTNDIATTVRNQGYAVIEPRSVALCLRIDLSALASFVPSWAMLPRDQHLKDGGAYRHRRHSCFLQDVTQSDDSLGLRQVPHRAHWQPTSYNALHGGIERWFEPMAAEVCAQPAWRALLRQLGQLFSLCRAATQWSIEAHQFRIDTATGIGRPTPEGAHRDGVDFVAIVMIGCHGIKGGETRVFEADGPSGVRFTLHEPWSILLLDDTKVIHETTAIQPAQLDIAIATGHRDTLVLTYRSNGFQDPG
jgi:hypothetical protein